MAQRIIGAIAAFLGAVGILFVTLKLFQDRHVNSILSLLPFPFIVIGAWYLVRGSRVAIIHSKRYSKKQKREFALAVFVAVLTGMVAAVLLGIVR